MVSWGLLSESTVSACVYFTFYRSVEWLHCIWTIAINSTLSHWSRKLKQYSRCTAWCGNAVFSHSIKLNTLHFPVFHQFNPIQLKVSIWNPYRFASIPFFNFMTLMPLMPLNSMKKKINFNWNRWKKPKTSKNIFRIKKLLHCNFNIGVCYGSQETHWMVWKITAIWFCHCRLGQRVRWWKHEPSEEFNEKRIGFGLLSKKARN